MEISKHMISLSIVTKGTAGLMNGNIRAMVENFDLVLNSWKAIAETSPQDHEHL